MIRGLLLALVVVSCAVLGHAADAPVDAYSAAMNRPAGAESPYAASEYDTQQVSFTTLCSFHAHFIDSLLT